MAKLLLVEDDARIASFIERGLATEGHVVDIAVSYTHLTLPTNSRV